MVVVGKIRARKKGVAFFTRDGSCTVVISIYIPGVFFCWGVIVLMVVFLCFLDFPRVKIRCLTRLGTAYLPLKC